MTTPFTPRPALLSLALAVGLTAGLAACQRRDADTAMPPPATTDSGNSGTAATPGTGTAPSGETSPHPGTGPGNGSTSIGGMSGGPGTGAGGNSGTDTPHATGGDGQAGPGAVSDPASAAQGTRRAP